MADINMDNIISNYYYLEGQNIVEDIPLQNAIFGFYFRNADVLKEKFQEYMDQYKEAPNYSLILNVESSPSKLMNLRDNLLFLKSTVDYYQNDFDVEKLQYVERDSKESILAYQKNMCYDRLKFEIFEDFPLYREKEYFPYLEGCSYSLFSFLKQFDESYFSKIIDSGKEVRDFFDSLETVQKWNSISNEVSRYVSFYHEVAGKLLYCSLSYLESNGISFDRVFQEPFHDEILANATNFSYEKNSVFQKTIELFPNAFSILDHADASEFEIPSFDYRDLLKFLETTNSYRKLFLEKKEDTNRFSFYRNMDFLLRHIANVDGYESFSLFDSHSKDYDRMEEYLSKLIKTHSNTILENTLNLAVASKYPILNCEDARNYYKDLKKYLSIYELLQDRFGISISALHQSIAINAKFPAPFLENIVAYVEGKDKSPSFDADFLTFVSFLLPEEKRKEKLSVIQENIDDVISSFYVISKLDWDIIYIMNLISYEKVLMGDFYE